MAKTTFGVGWSAASAIVVTVNVIKARQQMDRITDLSDLAECGPATRISFATRRKQAGWPGLSALPRSAWERPRRRAVARDEQCGVCSVSCGNCISRRGAAGIAFPRGAWE